MANTFSKTGITTGQSVEAWHVTQSIDAFSGLEAYDVSLSGSLNMTGSITGQPTVINNLTASYAISSSSSLNSVSSSYAATASYVSGNVTSASYAPNFANSDLTFTGNRLHNTSGSIFQVTTDNGVYNEAWLYMDINGGANLGTWIGWGVNYVRSYNIGNYFSAFDNNISQNSSSTIFNSTSQDIDFQVKSLNNTNMLFVNAGTNRVGINTNNPSATLGINGALANGSPLVVSGTGSHAEGYRTETYGDYSHADGLESITIGDYSYAHGDRTIASGSTQYVIGKYNKQNDDTSLFIVGNGTGIAGNRSDAFKVRMSGSIVMPTTQSVAPTWTGTDGEIVPATVSGQYYLYMWMNGAWRSGSFV